MLYDVASKAVKDTYDPKSDVSAATPIWTPDGKRLSSPAASARTTAVYAYDLGTNAS